MPFNTLSVATAVTPSVIETYFSHYLNRGPLKQKPTAHISYHEGLRLVRQFLDYSSRHTVEDLQGFTAQWVPAPTWVRIQDIEIAPQFPERAARLLQAQLGRRGVDKVGGATWWQWRRPEVPLKAEWIEMKKDFHERKRAGTKCDRVILYVHGGAYYFGSVDEHRYQMQRHARKLKARILAPRYRLAPQFPFPCGLFDCLATYLYLLEHFPPEQILFAGDSAGGGMVLGMLVTLRDQGMPLPAGTILLSPWVDLTHSFPSVAGDGVGDYIPPHGFHHKPSMAWPPPPTDETKRKEKLKKKYEEPAGFAVELPAMDAKSKKRKDGADEDEDDDVDAKNAKKSELSALPGLSDNLSIMLDGKLIELREQIQLYTTNEMLSHPLVSPVMQPSLGGLPPMLIQVGGAELLRDEQIYLAHKAANPKAYLPCDAVLNEHDPRREYVDRYPPTDVQLQLWEDLCHVPHTLSFTRPAKYMYRSVAQFGAWALAHAQHKGIDIQDDDAISIISDGPEEGEEGANGSTTDLRRTKTKGSRMDVNGSKDEKKLETVPVGSVGVAGDPLPAFKDHMIRERVTRHGVIYPLAPPSEMACLALDPASIGTIKPGPVRKWLAKKREGEARFGNEKKKVQKKRAKELAAGYDVIQGEDPPPTALVGRRRKGVAPEEKKKGRGWGLAMWSGWGSSHDESTLEREEKLAERQQQGPSVTTASDAPRPSTTATNLAVPGQEEDGAAKKKRRTSSASFMSAPWNSHGSSAKTDRERPRSPYRQVTDTGQAGPTEGENNRATMYSRRSSTSTSVFPSRPVSMAVTPPTAGAVQPDSEKIPGSQNTYLDPRGNGRPHNGVMAYPFRLRQPMSNPSIATLDSQAVSAVSDESAGAGMAVEMPTPADERVPVHEMPAPMAEPAPQVETTEPDEPVSAISAASPTSRTVTPTRAPPEDPISPIDTPKKPVSPSLELRKQVFDNRTSVLGAIGADGMPIAPLIARQGSPPASRLGQASSPESIVATASEGNVRLPESSPVSPVDGGAQLFKIRNPVFDARLANTAAPQQAADVAEAQAQPQIDGRKPGEATESTKAAPFKLRHTVVDPKLAPVGMRSKTPEPALPSSRAISPTSSLERSPGSDTAEKVASRAMTPVENQPQHGDLPPNSNIVMPTVVARRPIAMAQDTTPPKPPPKDEGHKQAILDRKASGDLKKSTLGLGRKASQELLRGMSRERDVKGQEFLRGSSRERDVKAGPLGLLPKSKFSTAPLIGDLEFEKGGGLMDDHQIRHGGMDGEQGKRPGLESFVTASEGELKRANV